VNLADRITNRKHFPENLSVVGCQLSVHIGFSTAQLTTDPSQLLLRPSPPFAIARRMHSLLEGSRLGRPGVRGTLERPWPHESLAPRPLHVASWQIALACYAWTSLLVLLGVAFGHGFLPCGIPATKPKSPWACLTNWDGQHFLGIVREGYSFDPEAGSNVAFFPAYPCVAWLVVKATGMPPATALILVSHASFAAALVLLAAYIRLRFPLQPEPFAAFALLAATLSPTTFFFRTAYSESLFLFATVLALYLMERKAPPLIIALVIGFATSVRIPGICLLCPFAIHLWRHSSSKGVFVRNLLLLGPPACWGLTAFMIYCGYNFGAPLAFAQAQAQWHFRLPPSWTEKLYCLATLEPLWSVFDPAGPCYWKDHSADKNPLFSLVAANPVYFVIATVLIALGAWKRWLSGKEVALAASLLFMTYAGRGYDMCMNSTGRFIAVVFPIYLVLAQLLSRCSLLLRTAYLAASAVFLTIYSALFAAWHFLI
jgi:Mannosyltransferase (PIG-V)